MADKNKSQSEAPVRVNLDEDPTVKAFQFLRGWAKKSGEKVCNSKGVQIKTASEIKTGGSYYDVDKIDVADFTEEQIKRGLALTMLQDDIEADKVSPFVNEGCLVYRDNPKPRPYNRAERLASA